MGMSARLSAVAVCAVTIVALVGCTPEAREDSELRARLEEADGVFRSMEYDKAGDLFEDIATKAESEGDNSLFVEAASMRARSYLITNRPDEGRPWLERAASKAVESDPAGWSRYLGVRGRFEWQDGDNEAATRTFREMFDYCEAHELWERAVDAAHMIALTGDESEKYDWSLKGIEMAEKGGMEGWLGPLWNNLGWNYYDDKRYDEAYDALVKAREYHYKSEQELPKLIADYAVAHVMIDMGRVGEAESDMRRVLEWAARLDKEGDKNATEWIGFARWDLGEIALARGDHDEGLGLLKQALADLERAGMPKWGAEDWKVKQDRVAELEG
jgi:tetratricopeptide (TPR) repeat protein